MSKLIFIVISFFIFCGMASRPYEEKPVSSTTVTKIVKDEKTGEEYTESTTTYDNGMMIVSGDVTVVK